MADFNLPNSTSLYSAVWTLLQAVLTSIVTWFDGTTDSNVPNKAKRYNTDTNKFQIYNSGTGTWSDLGFHTTIDNHINNNELHTGVPIGGFIPFGGTSAPTNFLMCNGAEVSRTTYANLFAVIGTNYGSGNGSTTFNVPNIKGRFVLGKADSGTGNSMGATGGSIDHTHSVPNHAHAISAHTHTMNNHTHSVPSHTHTTPSHEHTVPGHGHDSRHALATISINTASGSHSHEYGIRHGSGATIGTNTNRALRAAQTSNVIDDTNTTSSSGSTHTHSNSDFAGTVGNWNGSSGVNGDGNFNTSGYGGGTTGSSGPWISGTPSDNTTDSGGPTSTSTDGASTTGSNNPPFIVGNYIIRY